MIVVFFFFVFVVVEFFMTNPALGVAGTVVCAVRLLVLFVVP